MTFGMACLEPSVIASTGRGQMVLSWWRNGELGLAPTATTCTLGFAFVMLN